jgi:hypothetical protein
MINALLVIISPLKTWQRILTGRPSIAYVLFTYLLPLMILVSAGEAYGLVRWGKMQGEIPHLVKFTRGEAAVFEIFQFAILFLLVIVNAGLLKSTCSTFHSRHSFRQGFTVVAYALSPLFLFRLLNMFAEISPWLGWIIGIVLTISILYHGVPLIMDPDPAHAFGLYVITSLLLLFTTGLLELIIAMTLRGNFPKLMTIFSEWGSKLPL